MSPVSLVSLALASTLSAVQAQAAGTAGFDLDVLRERGIDPQVAEYFKDAARFRPGVSLVTLTVNGQPRGRVDARFNDQGELCFDRNLLDKGNLKLASTPLPAADTSCLDFQASYPQTVVELRPTREEVALIVPTAALRPTEAEISGFQGGGTAALLNYDIISARSQSGMLSTSFLSIGTELGLNMDDWIVRSRDMYSRQDTRSQRQHLYAYAQHTLVDYQSIFQGGQINVLNTPFATGPITGLQVVPEGALSTNRLNNVMVEGIAQGQARVEVRQSGALIYSTLVPGGPFALTDLPLLNATSDLDVTVIETSGAQRRFTVPAAALYGSNLSVERGYSVALGKQRALGNSTGRQPWLATITSGWPLGRDTTVNGGLLGATGYQAASWGLNTRLDELNLNLQQRFSHQAIDGERGTQVSVGGSTIVAQRVSLSLSSTQQTLGYRDLGDTSLNRDMQAPTDPTDPASVAAAAQARVAQNTRYRGQYSASLGWNHPLLGGINVSYSRSTQFGGPATQRATASWGKTFGFGTVNLNLERQLGGVNNRLSSASGNNAPATIFYLTLSIPLERGSARSYVNNSSGYQRMGVAYNDRLSDYGNYSLSAERDDQNGHNDASAQVALVPRYAQLNLGYARYGSGSQAYNGGLRGGMVWHQDGLTLSPYPVQDTFGVLRVGDISGIQVSTPYGPVWTDWNGQAVVAQLPPYSNTRLEVSTKTLPRNIDLRNGLKIVTPGRGAVAHAQFDVLRVRRILLNAHTPDGTALPRGLLVVDGKQQFVTTVVDDGQVFLLNGDIGSSLTVLLSEQQSCVLQYTLPREPDPDMFYETLDAVCRPELNVRSKGGRDGHG